MKFYIASGFQNKHLVRFISSQLKEVGWHHTYDWTKNERATNREQLQKLGEEEQKRSEKLMSFTYTRWRKWKSYRVWNGDCAREKGIYLS